MNLYLTIIPENGSNEFVKNEEKGKHGPLDVLEMTCLGGGSIPLIRFTKYTSMKSYSKYDRHVQLFE